MDSFIHLFVGRTARAARNCLYVLVCCLGVSGQAVGEESSSGDGARNTFANAQVIWQLKNAHQTSPGQIFRSKEGELKRQYVIESDADAGQQEFFSKAHFKLSMDVFAPAVNRPGQTKGKWYVQGIWTLVPEVQEQAASRSGVLTGTLSGRVQAVLTFDPTLVKKAWQGNVRIPMTRVRADNAGTGVRPMRGGGDIAFTSGSEGSLSVSLKLWPKL